MAEQLAITESGALKPVGEFTEREKWWCDGAECDGDLTAPHVHCPWGGRHLHMVDLLTGETVKPAESAP